MVELVHIDQGLTPRNAGEGDSAALDRGEHERVDPPRTLFSTSDLVREGETQDSP